MASDLSFETKRCNVEARFAGFQVSSLPLTLRDAIRVTRALNIPFLWIDSLCIVQDDTEDWKREASKMESVYSNAEITIAATCANSSWDGFLKRRTICETRLPFYIT